MKIEHLKRSSDFYLDSLEDCPLASKIMDEFLECRYQALKWPSNNLETFQSQKRKADEKKKGDGIRLMAYSHREINAIKQIDEKLAEAYEILVVPVWKSS